MLYKIVKTNASRNLVTVFLTIVIVSINLINVLLETLLQEKKEKINEKSCFLSNL